MRKIYEIRLSAVILYALTTFVTASAQTPAAEPKPAPRIHIGDSNEALAECFSPTGLDVNDAGALVAATYKEKSDLFLAFCGASALRYHPASAEIDNALLDSVRSENEFVMRTAIDSLVEHKNFEWVAYAAQRWPDIKELTVRISVAGALALGGRYDGWALIRSTVTQRQKDEGRPGHYAQEALWEVPKFAGMKDASGRPVNLNNELADMMLAAPTENKMLVVKAMESLVPLPPDRAVRRDGAK